MSTQKLGFTKVLVANRGEIALRIIKTLHKLGISSVAVCSDADLDAPYVKAADETVHLPGNTAAETYLVQEKIIEAAKRTGAEAIHPGFGFLSENAGFAALCAKEGLKFIGPTAKIIEELGDKKRAKEIAQKHKVPTIPGYNGADQSVDALSKAAIDMGFPVLLKASAGGGGKGMRIVYEAGKLEAEIDAAKRESAAAFGDDTLLIEKYFESARHIEVQILGDEHGNAVHLFERECSIQRRYQKIIEESPSPALTPELRNDITTAAINMAKAVNYNNAGTVEFILVPDGNFYFLEVNTRLQVEHPVTEAITGLDLVEQQLKVAQGLPLEFTQEDLTQTGHAIEVRLYAEDPYNNYLPVTGKIYAYEPALLDGLRYDSGVESGSVISSFYDPMIAKVIAYAPDRNTAIKKMNKALRSTVFAGPVNNKGFLSTLLEHPKFVAGDFDTRFLEHNPDVTEKPELTEATLQEVMIVATLAGWQSREQSRTLLQGIPSGWRSNYYQPQSASYDIGDTRKTIQYRYNNGSFTFYLNDAEVSARILDKQSDKLSVVIDSVRKSYAVNQVDGAFYIHHQNIGDVLINESPRFPDPKAAELAGSYVAPMPGQIVKVCVAIGDKVEPGDALIVINSMKMENTIEAFEAGEVEEIFVEAEGFVEADSVLIKMKTE